MKLILLTIGLAIASLAAGETYTDRFDNINVDEIVSNQRLLMSYVKCLLDQGKCTAEGKELKLHIKDAMQHSCEKCTEKQKQMARKVVNHIKAKEPEIWEQIKTKYDPGDKYKETYEAFLAAKTEIEWYK